MADPRNRDPAEGSRKTIDHELAHNAGKDSGGKSDGAKTSSFPDAEAPKGQPDTINPKGR
jgi:hypothetical protein